MKHSIHTRLHSTEPEQQAANRLWEVTLLSIQAGVLNRFLNFFILLSFFYFSLFFFLIKQRKWQQRSFTTNEAGGSSVRKTFCALIHSHFLSPSLSLFLLPILSADYGRSLFHFNQPNFLPQSPGSLLSNFKTVLLSAAADWIRPSSALFTSSSHHIWLPWPLPPSSSHLSRSSAILFISSPPPPVSRLHRGGRSCHLMASLPPNYDDVTMGSNRQRLFTCLILLYTKNFIVHSQLSLSWLNYIQSISQFKDIISRV